MKILIVVFLFIQFSASAVVDSLEVNDRTILEIKNGKEIFQPQNDWWDKYSSGLIAAFTVVISLGISVWQARKTTKANRENSIAEARIQWIQELRPLLGEFISLASLVDTDFENAKDYIDPITKKINEG